MKFNLNRYQIFVMLSGIAWSTLGVFSQWLNNDQIGLFTQVWWRMIVALVGAFGLSMLFKNKLSIQRKDLYLILVNAIIFVLGYTTFPLAIYLGVPIGRAVIILYTYPMLTLPLSCLLLKDKPSTKNFYAVGIMMVSLLILFKVWQVGFSGISMGDGMALIGAFVGAMMTVWGAKIRRSSTLEVGTTMFYTFLVAIPLLIIFGFLLNVAGVGLFRPVLEIELGRAWWSLIGIGLIPTVISVGLLYAGSKQVKPNVVGVLMGIEPLVTILLGWCLFGQVLDWATWVGGAGIMMTIFLL